MSLTSKTAENPAIDNLLRSSELFEWMPWSQITDMEPAQIDNVYYASRNYPKFYNKKEMAVMLLFLGNNKECTHTLVSEFARKYSLPTQKYNSYVSQYRRYSRWLERRNNLIMGFSKHNDNYYMVAEKRFYHCYSRYGFCSSCGILRCSPVWCICGHKQLCDEWTSDNKQIDEFIRKSQLQTNSPNEAYLEWISFSWIVDWSCDPGLCGLPTPPNVTVELHPLEIADKTLDLFYELCDDHPDILDRNVWVTIGFTYHPREQKYCLIKEKQEIGLCLACTKQLIPKIYAFCLHCKLPRLHDWTTGNKSLDSFIMESWSHTVNMYDAYIHWINYSLLTNVQEMTSLHHGCTHMAECLELPTNELTHVTLKKILSEQNDQLFDFYQLTKEYPDILTPDNIWILGITQEPLTQEYYIVFYHDIHALLKSIIQRHEFAKYMPYDDFYELNEIGAGSRATVYTAKYKKYSEGRMLSTVVLKRFKCFDEMSELFISEFRNHAKCSKRFGYSLSIYGITQNPETEEYMIVMQYAEDGNLLSYLDQRINTLTWRTKLECLKYIVDNLWLIHSAGLVHCDLHGEHIVLRTRIEEDVSSFICDFGLSRSVNSRESNPNIQGSLPFIAPEVFHTRKITQESDVYACGIIMHVIATGEQPFKDRQFDRNLACDIMGGLRPSMPDSAPEEYKNLAKQCCDADPDKRPDTWRLYCNIRRIIIKIDKFGDNTWDAVYHNHVKPLSHFGEESKSN